MSIEEVIRIHDSVIDSYGGRPGIHDLGLLESAVNHIWMQLEYGEEENQDIPSLAAIYFFHIIKNHSFKDGNKRTFIDYVRIYLSKWF